MTLRFLTMACLAALALLAGCGDDSSSGGGDGLATVRGTLTLHGEWPAEGDIQVSLFPQWDHAEPMSIAPGGPPEFYTEPLPDPSPGDSVHHVEYLIADVNPGLYPALVAGWRNGGTLGVDEPVIGMWGGAFAAGDTLPEALEVAPGDTLELAFDGWLDLVNGAAAVSDTGWVRGTVVFPGDWPTGFSMGLFALLMVSDDPAAPSVPIPGGMQAVSAASPDFELPVDLTDGAFSAQLVVYGYPFTPSAWESFFGGFGWDWAAGEPALLPVTLDPEHAVLENVTLLCRDPD